MEGHTRVGPDVALSGAAVLISSTPLPLLSADALSTEAAGPRFDFSRLVHANLGTTILIGATTGINGFTRCPIRSTGAILGPRGWNIHSPYHGTVIRVVGFADHSSIIDRHTQRVIPGWNIRDINPLSIQRVRVDVRPSGADAWIVTRVTGLRVGKPFDTTDIHQTKGLFSSSDDVPAVLIHEFIVGKVFHVPMTMALTPFEPLRVVLAV